MIHLCMKQHQTWGTLHNKLCIESSERARLGLNVSQDQFIDGAWHFAGGPLLARTPPPSSYGGQGSAMKFCVRPTPMRALPSPSPSPVAAASQVVNDFSCVGSLRRRMAYQQRDFAITLLASVYIKPKGCFLVLQTERASLYLQQKTGRPCCDPMFAIKVACHKFV